MKLAQSFIGLAFACAAVACAAEPEDVAKSLKETTASAVAGADIATIEVISSERSAAKWTWKAKIAGQLYACDADNMMRLPDCRPAT